MHPRFIIFSLFIMFINLCFAQTIQVNPDGTHPVIFHHGSTSTQINPNGTNTLISNNANDSEFTSPHFSRIEDSNETLDMQIVSDTTKTSQIANSNQEYVKLKSLLEQQAIDSTDYSILILRILNNIYDYYSSPADQIMDLKQSLDLDSITTEEYILKKDKVIYGK